jgi:hypothetical protein
MDDITGDSLLEALAALEAFLERRLTQAIEEVAHYPTPIARCDEQLTKLVEERGDLVVRLNTIRALLAEVPNEPGGSPSARRAVERFLDGYALPDDPQETNLVAAVAAATPR